MSAPVRIETRAWSDLRFATLARVLGLADADHAIIKCARIWSWQTENWTPDTPTYVVDADTIESILGSGGPAALVRAKLAEETPDGYRMRGSEGRIEWHADITEKRQRAGRARADKAKRDERGRLTSYESCEHGYSPPAHAGTGYQHDTSTTPAKSSVPVPVPVPVPRSEESLPARAIAPQDPPGCPPLAKRQETRKMLMVELAKSRIRVAKKLGMAVQPLLAQDPGERDLAEQIALATTEQALETLVAQVRHAIAVAEAETAAGEQSLEWFTGAVFAPRNFRRLAGKPLDAVGQRAPPRDRGGRYTEPQQPIRKTQLL